MRKALAYYTGHNYSRKSLESTGPKFERGICSYPRKRYYTRAECLTLRNTLAYYTLIISTGLHRVQVLDFRKGYMPLSLRTNIRLGSYVGSKSANIRLGWNCLTVTNTLAYWTLVIITPAKVWRVQVLDLREGYMPLSLRTNIRLG